MITVPSVLPETPSAQQQRWYAQGLRPVQIWVPDVRTPGFEEHAHQQSRAVAASSLANDDQAFIDAISVLDVGGSGK